MPVLAALFLLVGSPALKGQYCLPAYGFTCASGDYIDDVIFAGISNLNTNCGSPGTNNYIDYSATLSATVSKGQTYPITLEPGPTFGQYFIALIDLNQDMDFTDPGEFFDLGYAFGGGILNSQITIPCTALPGVTRLRILCRYSSTPLVLNDICGSLSFGEVEDYGITINSSNFPDANLTQLVSPVSGCGLSASEQVRIRVRNDGGITITSVTACYSVNGGSPVCQVFPVTLNSCDSTILTFSTPANLSIAGTYSFMSYVSVSGDLNGANDGIGPVSVVSVPVISSFPYVEQFDVTNGGYEVTGTNASWQWGVPNQSFIPAAFSAPRAWVTNLTSEYNPDELSYLASPCFDFSGFSQNAYLSFAQIFEIDPFGDSAWVDVSTNGGTTWTKLGTQGTGNGWYNLNANVWSNVSGNAGDWGFADHVLSGSAGVNRFRFRYVLSTDAFTELAGMGVDQVRIVDTLKNVGLSRVISPQSGCLLGTNETVSVRVLNRGSHSVQQIPVCMVVDGGSPVCEIVPGPIPAGDSVLFTFSGTANLSVLGSHSIVTFVNWSPDYNRLNDTLSRTIVNFPSVSSFPYVQDFEANNGGWAAGGNAAVDWAWGSPAKININSAGSGIRCWVTGGLGTSTYLDNSDQWVESPCFDFSSLSQPWVVMKAFWRSELNYDGAVLEYSTNGGLGWIKLGAFGDPFNWYNLNNVVGLSQVGTGPDGWSGNGGGWMQTKHTATLLAGQSNVRFRVHFASDASVLDDGFAFDHFIVSDPPSVDLGPDTMVCGAYTLNPNLSGGTFLWSNGAQTPTLQVSAAGTYTLQYTDNFGLEGRDTIVIAYSPVPAVDLGANFNFCAGDTACLTVDPVRWPSVMWGNGTTNPTYCTTAGGTIYISATDSVGCPSTDSVSTTVLALPFPFLGNDTVACPAQTICLTPACPGGSLSWSNGSTSSTVCVGPGLHWVECTDGAGCTGRDSILVDALPLVTAMGAADTSGCPVIQFSQLSSGNPVSQTWLFGDGNSSTSANPSHDYSPAGNGIYQVTLVSENSCGADTVTFPVSIQCLVGLDALADLGLTLFPNPTDGAFSIRASLPSAAAVSVQIADLQGRILKSVDFGLQGGIWEGGIQLDLSKGIYVVTVAVGDRRGVRLLRVE